MYTEYLNERQYDSFSKIDTEKKVYWKEKIGKETLEFISGLIPQADAFLHSPTQYTGEYHFDTELCMIYLEKLFIEESIDKNEIDVQKIPFGTFYYPFLKLAKYWIKLKLYKADVKYGSYFIKGLLESINKKLQKICLRILIVEMNVCKSAGELKGKNPSEEYISFTNALADEKKINYILEVYPLLLRIIIETIEQYTNYVIEILQRLNTDKKEIISIICNGNSFTKVLEIMDTSGDTHQCGKSVVVITLDNEYKLIYKPHSIKAEVSFQEISGQIHNELFLKGYHFKGFDKGEYGWTEYIEYECCKEIAELTQYYKRLGINIFLAYLLGAKDLHYENIIANGEYPVFIDVEVMFGEIYDETFLKNTERIVQQHLCNSVLNTNILPLYAWNQGGKGIDLSAVNGKSGKEVPFNVPRIKYAMTSDMMIIYEHPEMEGRKNLALLRGDYIHSSNFIKEIVWGFSNSYLLVMNNPHKWKRIVYKSFENAKCRYLVENTQRYGMMLASSYFPEVMMDGGDRHICLLNRYKYWMKKGEYNDAVVKSEIDDLLRGDIPYFCFDTSSKELITSKGVVIAGFFKNTAMERFNIKLNSFSKEDMNFQVKIINLSLSLSAENEMGIDNSYCLEPVSKQEPLVIIHQEPFKLAAQSIGKLVLENSIYTLHGKDVNWLSISLKDADEHMWHLQAADMYLYSGIAGISVYMHTLLKMSSNGEYNKICSILDQKMFSYTDNCLLCDSNLRTRYTGALNGESSLIYAYQILFKITGNTVYLEYAKKHCTIVEQLLDQDHAFDLMAGNAGAVLVYLNMYELTGNIGYRETAETAAQFLIQKSVSINGGIGWISEYNKKPLAGFSHGCGGILLAFSRLQQSIKENRFNIIIEKIMVYENSLFDNTLGNWKDIRIGQENTKGTMPVSWCHGAAGILLSRLSLCNWDNKDIRTKADYDCKMAFKTIYNTNLRKGQCLCHGNTGNIMILLKYIKQFGNELIYNKCESFMFVLAKKIIANKAQLLPQEIFNPGFMAGMTGIGYSLLMSIDKDLPFILDVSI